MYPDGFRYWGRWLGGVVMALRAIAGRGRTRATLWARCLQPALAGLLVLARCL